jgi:integral membrane protein (TIGR01906 family)
MNNRLWTRLIQWLLVLALPLALLIVNMHIATGHWFVHWEYGKTDFPPDRYGLSTAERTHLAQVCVDYLATDASLSLLEELRLPSGEPAFNGRELRHMDDVQMVYNHLTTAGIVAALAFLGGTIVLYALRCSRHRVPAVLVSSSLLTLGLLGAIAAYMILGWNSFFTTFHRIFFEGESWIFDYSDTLIRLFPVRFWMDVALVIVGLLVIQVILIGGAGWVWIRRIGPDNRV